MHRFEAHKIEDRHRMYGQHTAWLCLTAGQINACCSAERICPEALPAQCADRIRFHNARLVRNKKDKWDVKCEGVTDNVIKRNEAGNTGIFVIPIGECWRIVGLDAMPAMLMCPFFSGNVHFSILQRQRCLTGQGGQSKQAAFFGAGNKKEKSPNRFSNATGSSRCGGEPLAVGLQLPKKTRSTVIDIVKTRKGSYEHQDESGSL